MRSHHRQPAVWYLAAVCGVAAAIPWPFLAGSIAIGVLAVAWLFSGRISESLSDVLRRPGLLCWLLFLMLHAASYFWSADKGDSLFDLESKLSFLLLPLLVGGGPPLRRRDASHVVLSFIVSLAAAAVVCLIRAAVQYQQGASGDVFFYHNLVSGFFEANAVYFAWYSLVALGLLAVWEWPEGHLGGRRWLRWSVFALLALFFVLLSSKTLLLLALGGTVLFLIQKLQTRQLRLQSILFWLGALLVVFTVIVKLPNPIQQRYRDVLDRSDLASWRPDAAKGGTLHFNNFTLRLFLWKTGLQSIQHDNRWVLGCGNGGVKQAQKQRIDELTRQGYDFTYNPGLWHANMHNMYMQSLLMLGGVGLGVFLAALVAPFRSWKRYRVPAFFFQLVSLLFFFQEAALQTQAGIVFYLFFLSFFYNVCRKEEPEPSKRRLSMSNADNYL